jgi:hypothetical protein
MSTPTMQWNTEIAFFLALDVCVALRTHSSCSVWCAPLPLSYSSFWRMGCPDGASFSVILFPLSFHPTPPNGKGCGRVRDRVGSLSLSFSLFFSLSFSLFSVCPSLSFPLTLSHSLSFSLSLSLLSLYLCVTLSLSLPQQGRGEEAGCTEKAGLVLSHGNYGKWFTNFIDSWYNIPKHTCRWYKVLL